MGYERVGAVDPEPFLAKHVGGRKERREVGKKKEAVAAL
jgi:hypothetical protein